MAEVAVEKEICQICGADVRAEALFCYNCGGAVAGRIEKTENKAENKNGNNKTRDVWRQDNSEEFVERVSSETKFGGEVQKTEVAEKAQIKNVKPDAFEEAKLKSAASMRRRAKSFQRKQVEVVWEEPENVAGGWLIFIALLLTAFAGAIIVFALYLK